LKKRVRELEEENEHFRDEVRIARTTLVNPLKKKKKIWSDENKTKDEHTLILQVTKCFVILFQAWVDESYLQLREDIDIFPDDEDQEAQFDAYEYPSFARACELIGGKLFKQLYQRDVQRQACCLLSSI
jgi:hypothetical protein